MKYYRFVVKTDAAAFADPDELAAVIEVALDVYRRNGETAAAWLDGEVGSDLSGLTTEPVSIDPDYIRARRLEEDPYDVG